MCFFNSVSPPPRSLFYSLSFFSLFFFLFPPLAVFQAQEHRKKSQKTKTKNKSKSGQDTCICHSCGVRVESAELMKKHMETHQLKDKGPKVSCPHPGSVADY